MVYTHIWGIAEKVSSSFPKVICSDSGKWVMLRTFQHPLYINVLISFTDVLRILTWQLPIRQQKMKRYSGSEIASLLKVVRHFMFKVRNCWKCLVHSQEKEIFLAVWYHGADWVHLTWISSTRYTWWWTTSSRCL